MPEGTDPTLALVLTGAGVTVSAGLIASLIEIAKRLPGLGDKLVGSTAAALATVLSALLVAYAYVATTVTFDPVSAFGAFLAFVGIAGLAGKAYDVVIRPLTGGNP